MVKLSQSGKPSSNATMGKFLPVLLSFGPMFMYLGLEGIATLHGTLQSTMYLVDHFIALLGVGSLSWGLSQLLIGQKRILQRLAELEALKIL